MSNTNKPQEFMAAYDINNSDGSATLNLMKAALLPSWRETFKKLEASSQLENKKRRARAATTGESYDTNSKSER